MVCQGQIGGSQVSWQQRCFSKILLSPVQLTSATGSKKKTQKTKIPHYAGPVPAPVVAWDIFSKNSCWQISHICKVKTAGCGHLGFQLNYWCGSGSQCSAPMETSLMESDMSTSQLSALRAVFCRNISAVSTSRRSHTGEKGDDKHKSVPRLELCDFPACVSRIKRENYDAVIRLGPRRADGGADSEPLHSKVSGPLWLLKHSPMASGEVGKWKGTVGRRHQNDEGREKRGLACLQAMAGAPKLACLPDWGQLIEWRLRLLVAAAVTSAQKPWQRIVTQDVWLWTDTWGGVMRRRLWGSSSLLMPLQKRCRTLASHHLKSLNVTFCRMHTKKINPDWDLSCLLLALSYVPSLTFTCSSFSF